MSILSLSTFLQSVLVLLSLVSANPSLSQATKDAVTQVAQQAVVQAKQTLGSGSAAGSLTVVKITPTQSDALSDGGYATNGKLVYYFGTLVPGADPDTFAYLATGSRAFGKDATHVYWGSELILGANPKTFVVLAGDYSRDNDQVYHGTQLIPEANPLTYVAPAN